MTMTTLPAISNTPSLMTASLVALADEAAALAENARAVATKRAYQSDWTHFENWCSGVGLAALPAAPTTIGLYVAAHRDVLALATIGRRVSAIAVAHRLAEHPCDTCHPAIQDVLAGLRRAVGTRQRQAAPLTVPLVRQALVGCGSRLLDVRDRALILVALAGALRRSEVVALDVADITHVPGGLRVLLRRSKGDQDGAGELVQIGITGTKTCPVAAYAAWIARSGIIAGPAFRSVTRHGRIGAALTARHVSEVIKKRLGAAGHDATRYSAHSCRAGFATMAAQAGVEERIIARQTRHRSTAVLRGYIREGELFHLNLASQIGL